MAATHMALEYGQVCLCGDGEESEYTAAEVGTCDTACSGDASTMCGKFTQLTVGVPISTAYYVVAFESRGMAICSPRIIPSLDTSIDPVEESPTATILLY